MQQRDGGCGGAEAGCGAQLSGEPREGGPGGYVHHAHWPFLDTRASFQAPRGRQPGEAVFEHNIIATP